MKTKDRSARPRFRKGLISGLLGGLGILPLLPIVNGLAIHFSSPSELPGLERQLGDVKQVTYAEAAVLLVDVPFAALLFRFVLPRLLESAAARGRLSFEWTAAGFAISLFPALRGVLPKHAYLDSSSGQVERRGSSAPGSVARTRGSRGARRPLPQHGPAPWAQARPRAVEQRELVEVSWRQEEREHHERYAQQRASAD